MSINFSFSFLLAAFWSICRRNKKGDGLDSWIVNVWELEDAEYTPEAKFFILFAEDSDEHANLLGSSFNNFHTLSNINIDIENMMYNMDNF